MAVGRASVLAILALVATACIALGATAKAGPGSRPKCERAQGKTIAANERVRVLASGDALYACAMASGRMFSLGEEEPDNPCAVFGCDFIGVVQTRLAGRYVAYVEADFDRYGGSVELYLLDTKLARRRGIWREANTNHAGLAGLVLARRGGLAWLVAQPGTPAGSGTRRVFKADAGAGRELLDERPGEDIGLGSLALSESERMIYWTNSGMPRSAPIR